MKIKIILVGDELEGIEELNLEISVNNVGKFLEMITNVGKLVGSFST